jgi:hypothetical protein
MAEKMTNRIEKGETQLPPQSAPSKEEDELMRTAHANHTNWLICVDWLSICFIPLKSDRVFK